MDVISILDILESINENRSRYRLLRVFRLEGGRRRLETLPASGNKQYLYIPVCSSMLRSIMNRGMVSPLHYRIVSTQFKERMINHSLRRRKVYMSLSWKNAVYFSRALTYDPSREGVIEDNPVILVARYSEDIIDNSDRIPGDRYGYHYNGSFTHELLGYIELEEMETLDPSEVEGVEDVGDDTFMGIDDLEVGDQDKIM